MRYEMRNGRYTRQKYLIGLIWLALVVFSSSGYGLSARPPHQDGLGVPKADAVKNNVAEIEKAESTDANTVEASIGQSKKPNIVETACELIYQGQFWAAGELIESIPSQYDTHLHSLLKAVYEYEAISQRRGAMREAAYRRQLAALEKLRVAPDSNDVNDVNAVGNITKALSVIAQASEFANQKQKDELVSDPFVKRVFQAALDRAADFESKGKWLDAYINCYSWLQAIEPDNNGYSDYAEQLAEKANIGESFKDNPCESREERYEKVEKQMFVRAIHALNFNYVNIIDYRQMASKAVQRCELLAEVISSSAIVRDALYGKDAQEMMEDVQYNKKLAAWSTGLAAILDEVGTSVTSISTNKFIDVFEKVLALNAATLELPQTVLIAEFAEAALSTLDPYTVMIWPRQVQDFEKTMTNEFTGIGIEITKQKGLLTVASLLPDTPAYNSGLDAGDVIEKVDGVETKDMSLTCAVRKITGPAGTDVTLTIRRPGVDKTTDICITRAKIIVPTIRGWQRTEAGQWRYTTDDENKIGYIRITSFSATTAPDLEEVLNTLEPEGLKGLILDLRFNSGGLLDSAIDVADKFIEEGLIVKTRPRYQAGNYAAAHKENTHPDYPLVILINRFSASASEIVAGALQDKAYKRAILVGERTHGKGSVQGITTYPGAGAQLKYTMAYYHLPSGQRVESQDAMKKQERKDWGVGPDIEIELRSDELKELIDVQRDNDVLFQAGHDNGNVPPKRHTLEETLATDPHLAVGILVVKSKLIQEETKSHGAFGFAGFSR